MGLNINNLVGNFDHTWIELNENNLRSNSVIHSLNISTEKHMREFLSEIKELKNIKIDGIIREIYPTVYFVYDFSINKFNFYSLYNDKQRLYPFSEELHQKLFAEIYSSDVEFKEKYQGEDCLVCLNEREITVEDLSFYPKYLILGGRIYADIEFSSYRKRKSNYSDMLFGWSNICVALQSILILSSEQKGFSPLASFFMLTVSNFVLFLLFERKYSENSKKICLVLNTISTLGMIVSYILSSRNLSFLPLGLIGLTCVIGSLYKFLVLEKKEYQSKLDKASSRHLPLLNFTT